MSNTTSFTQCTNCNGDLTFNPSSQTLDCPFCNSSFTLKGAPVKKETVINEAPQLLIPFAFGKEVFNKSALEWLSQGEFTPADILNSYYPSATKGIYVPLYLWQISYVITSPAGSKADGTMAINIADGQKPWPKELIDFTKSMATVPGHLKAFNAAYTLGFEVQEEEVTDINAFNNKSKEFAKSTVAANNHLPDDKNIVITELGLTKVYAPFWINRYNYKGQNYEVIMSGADVTMMGGTRPADAAALAAVKPSFVPSLFVLMAALIVFTGDIIWVSNHPGNHNSIPEYISMITLLTLIFVVPTMVVITVLRRRSWNSPVVRLKKERELKLSQRLAQKG